MRVQRVVLEHHRDVAVLGRLLVDDLAADLELAIGDVLESGDHPQRGRLPASGRADEDHQLAVGDVEIQVLDGLEAVRVALGHILELDLGHSVRLLFGLSLDCARGQPGDDPSLEDQDEQHHRDRHDYGGGSDVAVGHAEL